jgi:uncharacterized protein
MTLRLDKFSRVAALKPTRGAVSAPKPVRAPDEEDALSRILGAGIASNRYGEHISIRHWCSTPEFAEPSAIAIELLSRTRDESLSARMRQALSDPEKWLFLDTETTGLSGGTGTYAFLIGLAWWDAGGLQIEQFLMRDFGEEHAILHEVAARLAERPVLVTFNGKSFDWPLLESRYTMTRVMSVPKLAAHLDLLHPARALWKLRLGSVRLVELEREVLDARKLGWHREDDVASALIPQHYFNYLRGGPVEPVAAIVRHNQMDLRGLAALFGKVDELLAADAGGQEEIHSLDLFGLSRFLKQRGNCERAHLTCSQALALGLPMKVRPQARRDLAALAKRKGDHDSAVAIWEEMQSEPLSDARDAIYACEQLAIYYERRQKDYARAAEFAGLALAKLRRLRISSLQNPAHAAWAARSEEKFLNRVARLEHRMACKPSPRLLLISPRRAAS